MDLRTLEHKLPTVAPLLVRLYNEQQPNGLSKEEKLLARRGFSSTVADMMAAELNDVEKELLSDILIGLISQAEKDLRIALAERLSTIDTVPLRLVLHLANDEIEIATPVLAKSKVLTDLDLVYIIKSQTAEYWPVIAARQGLGAHVAEILAETRDVATAITLSENDGIELSKKAYSALAAMAVNEKQIAKPLLMRDNVPDFVARKLYEHVGKELRDYIRAHFGVFNAQVMDAVDDLIIEFAEAQKTYTGTKFMPTTVMMNAARKYRDLGQLNTQMMVDALKRGQIASFIALFAIYTGIKAKTIHAALQKSCPKGMAIACRAFGIQKNDFSMMFLLTNRMRSSERIVNQNDMLELLSYFDRVRPEVAQRILNKEI